MKRAPLFCPVHIGNDDQATCCCPSIPKNFTPALINRTWLRKYALLVSQKYRAGKFIRVSKKFSLACDAALEAKIRGLVSAETVKELEPCVGKLLSPLARKRVFHVVEDLARAIIRGKVVAHPSIGKTLTT